MNLLKSSSHLRIWNNINKLALSVIQNLKCENRMAWGGIVCLLSFTKIIKMGEYTHRHRPLKMVPLHA